MADLNERVRKLRSLAKDQEGKPEGKLAAEILKRILEKYPDLDIEEKEVQWQNIFKNEYDYLLWTMACKAHEIKLIRYNAQNPLEFISEGYEIEMIMAKTEWEFALDQFQEISSQVIRGIINKFWPQICKSPSEIEDYVESQFEDFARKTMERVITPKKAISEKVKEKDAR